MSHLKNGGNFHTREAFRPTITAGDGGAEAPPQGQYILLGSCGSENQASEAGGTLGDLPGEPSEASNLTSPLRH